MMKNSKKIKYGNYGVTYPKDFIASGLFCGLKKNQKPDLGLIVSKTPAKACGVFTKNQFIAAPIKYSKDIIAKFGKVSAMLVNSGNANACTGKYGLTVVNNVVNSLSENLKINKNEITCFSTGSIGVKLPYEKITQSLPALVKDLSIKNYTKFSQSILTTDAFKKNRSAVFNINGKPVHIGVCAKGAGMIEPSMATMLCFITSDLDISKDLMQSALDEAVQMSFNRISVDGDMSTNDSVVLLCNGASNVKVASKNDEGYKLFKEALTNICIFIAQKIVEDGEGSTKIMKVFIDGAKTKDDAVKVARSISNSQLLKCAIFGEVPNWGRIMSSIGATDAKINFNNFNISLQGKICFKNNEPVFDATSKLVKAMKKKIIEIKVSLGSGTNSYTMMASDLGYNYVDINKV